MEEAAENLGCSGFTKFRKITLPLIMPELFAGGTIIFIWSFTELSTPLLMNYTRCAAVQVYDALKEIGSNPFPYALVFVMLSCSVLLYTLTKLIFGRKAYAMQSKAAVSYTARRVSGIQSLLMTLPFLLVISLALLPHAGVILTSFGTPGSWYQTVMPMQLSVVNYPVWQSLFDVRTNPTLFLVIAYAVRRLPYMVRSAVAGLQQTSVMLEESAANLRASPLTTVRRITLPLITANLIAGTLLAFAFSMLEVSDSLMLAQRADFYPITKTIYELFQLIGTGKYVASALGVWAMVFLAVTILGSSLLLGKKLGAVFRV